MGTIVQSQADNLGWHTGNQQLYLIQFVPGSIQSKGIALEPVYNVIFQLTKLDLAFDCKTYYVQFPLLETGFQPI
jgi:hypothetical protein